MATIEIKTIDGRKALIHHWSTLPEDTPDGVYELNKVGTGRWISEEKIETLKARICNSIHSVGDSHRADIEEWFEEAGLGKGAKMTCENFEPKIKCGECKKWMESTKCEASRCSVTGNITLSHEGVNCTIAERKESELRDGDVIPGSSSGYYIVPSGMILTVYNREQIGMGIHNDQKPLFNILDLASCVKSGGKILEVPKDHVGVSLTKEECEDIIREFSRVPWNTKSLLTKIRAALEERK